MSVSNKPANTGYKYVKPNPKAPSYTPSQKSKQLPPRVDLRPFMTPVEDQRQTNSCTANAVAGAYEYLVKKIRQKGTYDVSRLFIYYNGRWYAGQQDRADVGSVIQYAVDSLKKYGACAEKVWDFDEKKVTVKPDPKAYQQASRFKVKDCASVELKLDVWKNCLAEGHPIIFGTTLFDSFDECNKRKGVVGMPTPADAGRGEHGRHAMLCVGYSDAEQLFIVRNSWGDKWGDKGYCYMPYNYLMNPKLTFDAWMIETFDHVPEPEEGWVKDPTKPIVKNVKKYQQQTPVYEIEEYEEVADNLHSDEDDDTDYQDDPHHEYHKHEVEEADEEEDEDQYFRQGEVYDNSEEEEEESDEDEDEEGEEEEEESEGEEEEEESEGEEEEEESDEDESEEEKSEEDEEGEEEEEESEEDEEEGEEEEVDEEEEPEEEDEEMEEGEEEEELEESEEEPEEDEEEFEEESEEAPEEDEEEFEEEEDPEEDEAEGESEAGDESEEEEK